MDPANAREAMREIELDLEEGADMIMVKPAMAYLDIIRQARDRFEVPLGAYQVSGEFSMIMAAANNGWIDLDRTILESLTSIRRAGADFILDVFCETRHCVARLIGRQMAGEIKPACLGVSTAICARDVYRDRLARLEAGLHTHDIVWSHYGHAIDRKNSSPPPCRYHRQTSRIDRDHFHARFCL